MNVVLVLIDSLNRSALSAYGPTPVKTPAFERLAGESVRFDRHYIGSLPCMPARREIFSGRTDMLWRPWGPLEPFDDQLPVLMRDHGYRTAIVTDHYHYWEEPANGYVQGFESTRMVRGHEMDRWQPRPRNSNELPAWIQEIERWRPGFGAQYWANTRDLERDEDYFPAQVFGNAARWIEDNGATEPFFLQVESFDVHEPFDIPEPYRSMYAEPGSTRESGDFNVWPPYQDKEAQDRYLAQASEAELEFLRAQYAGKVTMVDRWLGELVDTLERTGHLDDTMLIVTTDHGHDLAQRGNFGKQWPHLDSHARIPLFIRHPEGQRGVAVSSLTTTVDLHSTILHAAGGPDNSISGQSLLPLALGEPGRERSLHTYGTFGQGVALTDGRYTLFKSPRSGNQPLFAYSTMISRSYAAQGWLPRESRSYIPGVALPVWKIPVEVQPRSTENALYDLSGDPRQEVNLWESQPDVRDRLLERLRERLQQDRVPGEQFERLELH